MNNEESRKAHEVSEAFQDAIIGDLSFRAQEYVLVKAHDEFRFWRVSDALKEWRHD
jgi:hypothetical protein